jgi:glycosyltransferase involved in cell wall biosynthesis
VILYTPYSLKKIEKLGLSKKKFEVVCNSISNSYPILPETRNFFLKGVLFIGRLREECNLELLCDAVIQLREKIPLVELHVIGSGSLEHYYTAKYSKYDYIYFHGKLYDQAVISEISKKCSLGCYPGNAGLSVVHYMSLSLPCLVHDNIAQHSGPEPSYVVNNYNGYLFRYGNKLDFQFKIGYALDNPDSIARCGSNAYKTYRELTCPSYASRFVEAMK